MQNLKTTKSIQFVYKGGGVLGGVNISISEGDTNPVYINHQSHMTRDQLQELYDIIGYVLEETA